MSTHGNVPAGRPGAGDGVPSSRIKTMASLCATIPVIVALCFSFFMGLAGIHGGTQPVGHVVMAGAGFVLTCGVALRLRTEFSLGGVSIWMIVVHVVNIGEIWWLCRDSDSRATLLDVVVMGGWPVILFVYAAACCRGGYWLWQQFRHDRHCCSDGDFISACLLASPASLLVLVAVCRAECFTCMKRAVSRIFGGQPITRSHREEEGLEGDTDKWNTVSDLQKSDRRLLRVLLSVLIILATSPGMTWARVDTASSLPSQRPPAPSLTETSDPLTQPSPVNTSSTPSPKPPASSPTEIPELPPLPSQVCLAHQCWC